MRLPWRPPTGEAGAEAANAIHVDGPADVAGVLPAPSMLGLWPGGGAGRDVAAGGDLGAAVAAGRLVPLDVGSGGEYAVLVRVGSVAEPAELTERELRYLLLASEPYLLVSEGRAIVGGVEQAGSDDDALLVAGVPPGRWGATVHVLDWELEPGAVGPDGDPAPDALPDFVVLLNPERGGATRYRTALQTFDTLV